MTTETVLLSACLAISLLNLISTFLLSNFIFRVLVGAGRVSKPVPKPTTPPDEGLVDLNYSPTYDPRFRDI